MSVNAFLCFEGQTMVSSSVSEYDETECEDETREGTNRGNIHTGSFTHNNVFLIN